MATYRYGVDADLDELRQIQRIERPYGVRRLHNWLGEGMPYEAMGNPHTMGRFRERKGTPVPWNVEAKNEESLQRSRRAIQRGPRSGETGVPDAVRDVLSAPGQSLDPSIQRAMEERMGDSFGVLASEAREGSKGERSESFGDIQIHTGPQAAAACDSINARAFTVGNHVAFDRGEYDPGSAEGQHVIAHELAHVRQQTGGRLSMLPQDDLALEIDPDPELEREAEETAQRVMSGGELGIQRLGRSKVHVQRLEEDRVFEALAIFEAELEVGEGMSETRERHNQNQLEHLHSVANDAIEKKDSQSLLDIKEEVQTTPNPNPVAEELANRRGSIADLRSEIETLKQRIDDDLEDVALTDDQRNTLHGKTDTDRWGKVSWGTVKKLLSVTGLPQLMSAVTMGSKAADKDLDEIGVQMVGHVRRGELTSLDDLKNIWRQTDGTLEERAEQIEEEIRKGTWKSGLGDSHDVVESQR